MHPLLTMHPLFNGLDEAQLEAVNLLCHEVAYKAQHTFIKEHTHTTKCYIVIDGSVEIFKTIGTDDFLIAKLHKNDIVGEMAGITNQPRSASAKTLEPVTLLVIDMEELKARPELAAAYSILIANIASELTKRVRETNQTVIKALTNELAQTKKRLALGRFAVSIFYIMAFYELGIRFVHLTLKGFFQSTTPGSVVIIFFIGASLFFTLKRSGYTLKEYGVSLNNWRKHSKEAVIYTAPILLLILVLKWIYIEAFDFNDPLFDPKSIFFNNSNFSWLNYFCYLLIYILFCPIQEFIARCSLQGALQKFMGDSSFKERWLAIITSNLLFISAHAFLSVQFALAACIPGLLWGWLYDRQRSIVGVTVSHIMIGVWGTFIVGVPYHMLIANLT